MLIIPAIDLKNGKCVRLFQGDFNKETIYSSDPVTVAQDWENQGAKTLHLVDLDGAKNGVLINLKIIQEITKSVKIPVQIGGGIRSLKAVKDLLTAGVTRVVIGTIALEDETLLKDIIAKYKAQVVVALDTKDGILVKSGWLKNTNRDLFKTITQLEALGVQRFIYTDVTKDGTMSSPNFLGIESLLKKTQTSVAVAGGISKVSDLEKLKDLGVKEAIIGKALYEGKLTLKEALNVS